MKKIIVGLIFMSHIFFNTSLVAHAHVEEIDLCEVFEQHGSILLIIDTETNEIVHANEAAADF